MHHAEVNGSGTATRDLLQRSLLHQRRGACVAPMVGTPYFGARRHQAATSATARSRAWAATASARSAMIRLRRTTTDGLHAPGAQPRRNPTGRWKHDLPPRSRVGLRAAPADISPGRSASGGIGRGCAGVDEEAAAQELARYGTRAERPTGRWRVRALAPLVGITQGPFHVKRCVGDGRRSSDAAGPPTEKSVHRTCSAHSLPSVGSRRPAVGSTVNARSRESRATAR